MHNQTKAWEGIVYLDSIIIIVSIIFNDAELQHGPCEQLIWNRSAATLQINTTLRAEFIVYS